jgi:membrane-associated protease RseP (regulator of RpoE activity)
MKQLFIILLIVGLGVWGFTAIPFFGSYLQMVGLISVLIIAHELGHFTVAKKVGVKVERFGFGLPIGPTLLEKQIGETKFCLHPVLLGGYVSFPDDNPDSDLPEDSPRRFENKSVAARAAIAVAGVTVNFILGYLIMVFVIATWGYPGNYYVRIQELLSPQSPAAQAGLLPGDLFLKVGGQEIKRPETLVDYLGSHKGQKVPLVVERAGAEKEVVVTPNEKGKIDISLSFFHKYLPVNNPVEVLTKSYTFLQEKMVLNFQAMGEIFTGKRSSKEVSGPVGIIKQGGQMIQVFGIAEGLVITALISVILGIMNILPIPMLDGGHLLFMFFEKIQGHPLKKEIQERVIQVSFVILIGLMCLILFNDVNTYILGR